MLHTGPISNRVIKLILFGVMGESLNAKYGMLRVWEYRSEKKLKIALRFITGEKVIFLF